MRLLDPEVIAKGCAFEGGFHRVDWEIIRRWIDANVSPENLEQAWNETAICWVNRLRDDLGGDYFVLESRQTILLSDQPKKIAQWLLDYSGRAAITIKEQLGDAAWRAAYSKDVVLIFSDDDDYYQYLAFHTPEGEQAASGGVCIHSGYTHIAIPWRDEFDAANAIIHELSHDCVAHLSLPMWLNEGLAMRLQKAIAPDTGDWRPPVMWDELAERHFAFWNENNIQEFWAGTSFFKPGDSNELSYSLAEVLLELIAERATPAAFRDFLQAAQQPDAGQTAAIDILGTQLGDIAGTFLGAGDWQPKIKKIVEAWERAGWKQATN
jgi:hypothetical protein